MHAETTQVAGPVNRSADPWSLLTGGSTGIVIGFAVDLVRLVLHKTKRAQGWSRSAHCSTCGAR